MIAYALDQTFLFSTGETSVHRRAVIVPSGVRRAVDGFGLRMAVALVDPGLTVHAEQAAVPLRSLNSLAAGFQLDDWDELRQCIGLAPRTPGMDPRICKVADRIRQSSEQVLAVEALALDVGLSASRLEHLFKDQVGCPTGSFRKWHRFRAEAKAIVAGENLTMAALTAGFYDSAHFARAVRQSFGIPPSLILRPGLKACVVPTTVESPLAGP